MTADELRRDRLALGMTQAELAAALDVTPRSIGHWERGTRPIPGPVALVVHYMRRFGVPAKAFPK